MRGRQRWTIAAALACVSCQPPAQDAETSEVDLEQPLRRLWRVEDPSAANLAMTPGGQLWGVSYDGAVRFADDGTVDLALQLDGLDGYPRITAAPDGGVHVCAEATSEELSAAVWNVSSAGNLAWRLDFPQLELIDCAATVDGTLVLTGNTEEGGRLVAISVAGTIEREVEIESLPNGSDSIASVGDTIYTLSTLGHALRVDLDGGTEALSTRPDERVAKIIAASETLVAASWNTQGLHLTGLEPDGTAAWEHTSAFGGARSHQPGPRMVALSDDVFAVLSTYAKDVPADSGVRTFVHVQLLQADGQKLTDFTIDSETHDTFSGALAGHCTEEGLCYVAVPITQTPPGELEAQFVLDMYEVDLRP